MARIRQTLRDRTLRLLGEDLGGDLLERGAVHPIYGEDRRTPGRKGHNRPWRSQDVSDYLALGFTAGDLSGLTVWDFDRKDLVPPVRPNVTTRRGSHVYTRYAGEANLQTGIAKVDLLSNTNVVFWDDRGEKRVRHTELSDTATLHDWWRRNSGTEVRLVGQEKRIGTRTPKPYRASKAKEGKEEGTSTNAFKGLLLDDAPYLHEVRARGWNLNLEFIAEGSRKRVLDSEGRRNTVLHRQSLCLVQCGIDPGFLQAAAELAGLPAGEAAEVIAKAQSAYDPIRMPSVLDRADAWQEAAARAVHRRLHPMLAEIARRAVEQNTTIPMIVQAGFADHVCQTTLSRRLSHLGQLGILHAKPMGWRGERRRSNCYQLCMRQTVRFAADPCACTQPKRDPYPWELGPTVWLSRT